MRLAKCGRLARKVIMKRVILGLLMVAAALLVACAAGGISMNVGQASVESEVAAAPVLVWHREGGFAGFCDDVSVYADGRALIESCRETGSGRETTLTAEQRRQLAQWTRLLASFEQENSDPAVADAMTIVIVFKGDGAVAASDTDFEAMSQLAEQILRQGD